MYAYRVFEDNKIISGFSDDREWCGGKVLDKLLEEKNINNAFLAVSRLHRGPNLGQDRFKHIESVARDALSVEFLLTPRMPVNATDIADK